MLTMIIKFDGVLNGTEPLLESDLFTDPAQQQLGENLYTKTGLLGRIDPDLMFAGDRSGQGYRLDLVHVQQQNTPANGSVSVTTVDGLSLGAPVADLSLGSNVSTLQQGVVVPPGYLVEIISDAPSGGNIIYLGFTPLQSPADWRK